MPFHPCRKTDDSFGSMETLWGAYGLSVWDGDCSTSPESDSRVKLRLSPDCPVVIGRCENITPPYLDPAYRPTRIVPGTAQPIAQSNYEGPDVALSRAHFMLRGNPGGIVLTNGVPHVEGGIRPPTNGTWILQPTQRQMDPGEEYLIEHGASVSLFLPNRAVVQICAE
jgi:hypothetical protein